MAPEDGSGEYSGEVTEAWKRIDSLTKEIREIQRRQQRQQRAADEEVAAKRQLRQELIVANSVLV